MNEAKQELVKNWLIKAKHDLAAARKLSSEPEPNLDTAIYHCQQGGEKAIKGFLVFHDQRFDKTHEIETLILLATKFAPSLKDWLDAGERLTHYATAYRYPGESLEPSREEFQHALKSSEDFYSFILSLLPSDVHP